MSSDLRGARRKYLQSSAISNCVPVLLVTSRSRACALPKQIFGFNFPTISSIVYAGGRTIPTIYFQVLWQLGFESATSYTWQCFYWLAFECQPLGVKTILVLHKNKNNILWWGFHKCKCESDVQTNSRLPVPLSILVLKTNNANHMVTCYVLWSMNIDSPQDCAKVYHVMFHSVLFQFEIPIWALLFEF